MPSLNGLIYKCVEIDKEETKIKKLIHRDVISDRNYLLAEKKKEVFKEAEKAHTKINAILDKKEQECGVSPRTVGCHLGTAALQADNGFEYRCTSIMVNYLYTGTLGINLILSKK